jgi:nitrogen regulatory protein P-II 1
MKRIEAYIKPHRLDDVARTLRRTSGVFGMTVCDVRGWGHGKLLAEQTDATASVSEFDAQTKIEIVCSAAAADTIADAIRESAHTGLAGDGVIIISSINEVIRISTGRRGDEAF